jgi:hypothetical protein
MNTYVAPEFRVSQWPTKTYGRKLDKSGEQRQLEFLLP